jgi:hypothetical protein
MASEPQQDHKAFLKAGADSVGALAAEDMPHNNLKLTAESSDRTIAKHCLVTDAASAACYAFCAVWRERTRVIAREASMDSVLKFVKVFALGTWVGSIIYFVAIVTRGAFEVLTRDQAGLLIGFTLAGLHEIGIIAAVVYLIAAAGLAMSVKALVKPAALGVILMLLLTLESQRMVIPRMETLRRDMGSVESTPATDPRRVEFDRLHGVSVDLEAGVLLVGLVALFLTTREPQAP